ncbi:MAG: hypothetical protein QOH51_1832 [Acidobacteriota bacterium]|jgi:hypothetical protein|nr:hypothetical protein [Acidobacteriota bacterium]
MKKFSVFTTQSTFRLRAVALLVLLLPAVALAQAAPKILEGDALTRVIPTSFYFEGQSAPTQMRNAAAVEFAKERFTMAALVDASGYSSEVQAKYQGFFITDSPIKVEGVRLATGAYGFGFTSDGRMNIMDVGGRRVLSVKSRRDADLKRPRPLMMEGAQQGGVRLYSGRNYVTLSAR